MIRALRTAVARFYAVDGLFLASGLAFSFLICLIPFVLLGVSMVGFVLSGEQAAQEVVNRLARNFPVYRRGVSRPPPAALGTPGGVGGPRPTPLIVFSSPPLCARRRVL